MSLNAQEVRSRIYRLIFFANYAFGAIVGMKVLNEKYGLQVDANPGVFYFAVAYTRVVLLHGHPSF
jgi:hypothetical protein